jgi:hypothetical protein
MATYTLSAEIDRPYAEVVEATRAALGEQGALDCVAADAERRLTAALAALTAPTGKDHD